MTCKCNPPCPKDEMCIKDFQVELEQATQGLAEASMTKIQYVDRINRGVIDSPEMPHADMGVTEQRPLQYDTDLNSWVTIQEIPEPDRDYLKPDPPIAIVNTIIIDGLKYYEGHDYLSKAITGFTTGSLEISDVLYCLEKAQQYLTKK